MSLCWEWKSNEEDFFIFSVRACVHRTDFALKSFLKLVCFCASLCQPACLLASEWVCAAPFQRESRLALPPTQELLHLLYGRSAHFVLPQYVLFVFVCVWVLWGFLEVCKLNSDICLVFFQSKTFSFLPKKLNCVSAPAISALPLTIQAVTCSRRGKWDWMQVDV